MADVKISALTALASSSMDFDGDVVAIVDVDAGITKKITVDNLIYPININKATGVITDLGSVTTCDINGGTINGITNLSVVKASSGATATAGTVATFEDDDNAEISILGGSSSLLAINFGHSGDADDGMITYNTTSGSEAMQFTTDGSVKMTLDATGNLKLNAGNALFLDGGGNTYINESAGDTLNFQTGGSSRMTVHADATTIKTDIKLVPSANSTTNIFMSTSDSADMDTLRISGGGGIGTDRGATIIMYGNEVASDHGSLDLKAGWNSSAGDIRFFTGNNIEVMRMGYNGNLGLGNAYNSDPSNPLQIKSSLAAAALVQIYSTTGAVDNGVDVVEIRTDDTSSAGSYNLLRCHVAGTDKFSVNGDGTAVFGGTGQFSGHVTGQMESGSDRGYSRLSVGNGWAMVELGEVNGSYWGAGPHSPGSYGLTSTWNLAHYDSSGSSWTANIFTCATNGNVTISGSLTENSDIRLKENIKIIPNALDKINQMRGVSYNKIGEEEVRIGMVADEVEKIIPELVRVEPNEGAGGLKNLKSLAYADTVAVLVEAVKELSAKVTELENK